MSSKPSFFVGFGISPRENLLTARTVTGIKAARDQFMALVRNVGTFLPMPRENSKWQIHEGQSTDAGGRGGRADRSDEAW